MKDFLGFENDRNKKNAALYEAIIKKAWGQDTDVLIGHHLCTEQNKDLGTENEIPAADTLMFDHNIMRAVFGNECVRIMMQLAASPAEHRDGILAVHFQLHHEDVDLYGEAHDEAVASIKS